MRGTQNVQPVASTSAPLSNGTAAYSVGAAPAQLTLAEAATQKQVTETALQSAQDEMRRISGLAIRKIVPAEYAQKVSDEYARRKAAADNAHKAYMQLLAKDWELRAAPQTRGTFTPNSY